MNATRDPDRMIRTFLTEGEELLQDQVYDAVRAEIERKRQRIFIGPWRTPLINPFVTFGFGATAVLVIGLLLGARLLGSPTNLGGPSDATPTPEPTATSRPSVEPTTSADAFLPEGPFLVWDSPSVEAPAITMTISSPGWIKHTDYSALEKGVEVDNMPEALVLAGSSPPGTEFYVYGDPCQWATTRPEISATTADEIVAALAAQPSRDASDPVDVTLGGYAGKMITLHVPDDADFADCDGGEFASYTIEGEARWQWHQGPGQIDDFWFVDVEGSIVQIRAMYRPDTPRELVEDMRTLIESTTFQFR